MVVAQLVEQSLLTPEVRGSNPVIRKLYITIICQLYRNNKNKEKRGRERPNFPVAEELYLHVKRKNIIITVYYDQEDTISSDKVSRGSDIY